MSVLELLECISHLTVFVGGVRFRGYTQKGMMIDRTLCIYFMISRPAASALASAIACRPPPPMPAAPSSRATSDEQARRSSDRSDVTGERLEARRTSVPRPVHTACVRLDRRRRVSRVYTLPYVSWSVKPYAVKPYGAFTTFLPILYAYRIYTGSERYVISKPPHG